MGYNNCEVQIDQFHLINLIIKQNIRIYVPYGRQTAGPNGLKFFVDTHWWPGVAIGLKII